MWEILTQKLNTGWSNLFQHIKSQHSDYLQDAQSTLQSFVVSKPASTKKAANIYSSLEWICCGLKLFNFVENELTRKYCNLAPIAVNTLKKYMEIVTKEVKVVIKTKLLNRFVLVIDGWSKNSTHFVGVFASYSCENNLGYESALLLFSSLLTETSFNAMDHYDYFEWVYEMLDRYCKLRPFLIDSSFAMEQVVVDYLPTSREHADLLALLEPMMKLKSGTLALQCGNITIADIDCLFEKVTSEFPCTKKYLDPMAPIVLSPVFESAVCKLQNGQQSDLKEGEKGEISNLLIQSVSQPKVVRIVNEEEDFASSIIKKRRQECETKSPYRMYIDTRFLLPTSNMLERFFSTADIT